MVQENKERNSRQSIRSKAGRESRNKAADSNDDAFRYNHDNYYGASISNISIKINVQKEKCMRNLKNFIKEEDGMGTVEIVLIIVVLIALVAIFKDSIKKLVESILKKITTNANKI